MSFRSVKHLCGHEARYRLPGGRTLVEHHVHELERSPCTPCANSAVLARGHIYLGARARIVSLAGKPIIGPAPTDLPAPDGAAPLPSV
jgi:hypothetical protein